MPRKPLGPEQTICQAQDATRPEGGSQTPNHRDKEKQTGGVSACPTPPCLSSDGAAFGNVRTPPTRPSDRHPHGPLTRARATMIQSRCIGLERQDTGYWIRKNGATGCGVQTSSSGQA